MSTAGKVLTVLILLVMIVWVIVLPGVIQLNVNWEQKLAQQQKQLQDAQAAATKASQDILKFTEQARVEQDAKARDLRAISTQIAAIERQQSATQESLTRLKAQVADYQAAVERAKVNLTTREAEKVQAEEDLAKKREEVAKAQALNADLRGQVAQLQDEFKKLLADNATRVNQALKDAPTSRPASNRRPSPET